jgi:hypothetical protein
VWSSMHDSLAHETHHDVDSHIYLPRRRYERPHAHTLQANGRSSCRSVPFKATLLHCAALPIRRQPAARAHMMGPWCVHLYTVYYSMTIFHFRVHDNSLCRRCAFGLRKVEQLRKLLEARFARAAAIGARSLAAEWTVSMGGFIGEACAWPVIVDTEKGLP